MVKAIYREEYGVFLAVLKRHRRGRAGPQLRGQYQGRMFGMKHQMRQMLAQGGGVILNVASIAGLGGAPKLAACGAAKHAVVGLTRTAAVEYVRQGIRVALTLTLFRGGKCGVAK